MHFSGGTFYFVNSLDHNFAIFDVIANPLAGTG